VIGGLALVAICWANGIGRRDAGGPSA